MREEFKKIIYSFIDDWIYCTNVSDGFRPYKIKIDGTLRTRLSDKATFYLNVFGD